MTLVIANIRLIKIIGAAIVILLIVPLLIHHYLTLVGSDTTPNSSLFDEVNGFDGGGEGMPSFVIQLQNVDKLEGQDLKYRIEELYRIKQSVALELHSLEAKRRQIQLDITQYTKKLDEYKVEAAHKKNELDRLQISLEQAKVAEKEAMERSTPRLMRPKSLGQLRYREFLSAPPATTNQNCGMETCFDFSLCPISNPFAVFVYPVGALQAAGGSGYNESSTEGSEPHVGPPFTVALQKTISQNVYVTSSPYKACLFLVIVDTCTVTSFKALQHLLHWNGDGRNHIIWPTCSIANLNPHSSIYAYTGRAMVIIPPATSTADATPGFRYAFDLLSSYVPATAINLVTHSPEILQLPPLTPAKRKYLATYLGSPTDSSLQTELLKIQQEDPVSFVFQFSCASANGDPGGAGGGGGADDEDSAVLAAAAFGGAAANGAGKNDANKKLSDLCNNDLLRTRLLIDSTFTLILLAPGGTGSSEWLQLRIYESLKYGAIPVVIGGSSTTALQSHFPYTEVLDWHRVALILPWARITELHYFLKYVSDADLLTFRRNGRLFYERYLSSLPTVVDTVLGVLRTRIGLPATPYKDVHLRSVFNDSFIPLKMESITLDPEDEENLGPIEPPYPSNTFVRNFSIANLERYNIWNVHLAPFWLYPHTPWDNAASMPSEAKFRGSSVGFRPIGAGAGGAGKEFSESLGGNVPKEQFTIVMLTYERETVLMNSLARLYLLPYLNKVVVVWNSERPPSPELQWPDIGVPIVTVRAPQNSLNNRFLPFDAIETEAILSIDDDAHLRHDEIVFGFRVWREHRDRIVGFPGRFHAWDAGHSNWLYNSNYSCELSMVLTGAAFHHKLYSYLYTYEMSPLIRAKVDELMNCEDIAMNFLVSHVTGKPPVKVTSRWTFRCPGCPVTLSEDDSHFQERHACINYFSQVYGYTPLLYTQYRADSILFKTRIPHDKQKCFKYI